MSFPKQSESELPLLKTLQELGGKAEPKALYLKLAEMFPQLTEEDLSARMPSSPSTFRWHNIVQWSRQKLVEKGEIDGSTRGVWKLTPRGRARATGATANSSEELLLAHQATLKDLVYENESEVKLRIISELQKSRSHRFRTVLHVVSGSPWLRAAASYRSRRRSRHRWLRPIPTRCRYNSLCFSGEALAAKSGQPSRDRQVSRRDPRRL
jgi:hypothetical protein